MDTYDNNGEDPHPYIMVHYNEGNEDFQFAHDGASTFVGGCHADYRNAERTYIHLYIEDDIFSVNISKNNSTTFFVNLLNFFVYSFSYMLIQEVMESGLNVWNLLEL